MTRIPRARHHRGLEGQNIAGGPGEEQHGAESLDGGRPVAGGLEVEQHAAGGLGGGRRVTGGPDDEQHATGGLQDEQHAAGGLEDEQHAAGGGRSWKSWRAKGVSSCMGFWMEGEPQGSLYAKDPGWREGHRDHSLLGLLQVRRL